MRYKIFDIEGNHVNSIVADEAFVEQHFPGRYELLPSPPPPAPLPPTSADVDAERDRRISAGFVFGGILYQSRPEDRENITGASLAALAAMMNGAVVGNLRWHGGDSDFMWIAADNSVYPMDAQTVFTFGQTAMAHKQGLIFAARAIKDEEPIPADYTDDGYWP
ncbi:DUF4376 domain-containing protein [Shinella sp. CPCC 100929]|uniref:DUF4376 domain-containing protein n=1 Tax=Shinella lacus TaxID=2654216 RepID=A0ABT1R6Y8_9HYPH|nr:DUF4376 domain-containing protein [Shinella lacus]MCQ4630946.1 DUF4376 domain-containing protein [Shinella lacus]